MIPDKKFMSHGAPIREKRLLPVQPPGQAIGRNRELASMHVTIKAGASLLLYGPAGIGKTALAAVLATAQIASNPGGVLWLMLNEDDLTAIATRVARAYDEDIFSTATSDWIKASSRVRELLQKNRPLIIFDGLLDPASIREFVKQCAPTNAIIVISDRVFPGPWTPIELKPLNEKESQHVFRIYAGLGDVGTTVDAESLIEFLDGYPLTLELAGRTCAVDKLTAGEFLSSLPATGSGSIQQTVMSAVFKRLDTASQGVLLVLAATSTRSASVELLSMATRLAPADVIAQARKLVARGVAREYLSYGQVRYILHEVAYEFARNWLSSFQRLEGLEARVMQALLTYTELHAKNTVADHDRLADEIDNILGTAAYAVDRGKGEVLNRLTTALENNADDFIMERHFWLELDLLKKLASLLREAPTMRKTATIELPRIPSVTVEDTLPATATKPTAPAAPPPPPPEMPSAPDAETIQLALNVPAITIEPPSESSAEETLDAPTTPANIVIEEPPVEDMPNETQPAPPITFASSAPPPAPPSLRPQPVKLTPDKPTVETPSVTLPSAAVLQTPPPVETQANLLTRLEPPFPIEDDTEIGEQAKTNPDEDTELRTPPSIKTMRDMLVEARQNHDQRREALILQSLAQHSMDVGRTDEAISLFKDALAVFEKVDDQDGMLATLDVLASLSSYIGKPDDALVYATRGVNFAQQIGDKARLGRLQTRLADLRLGIGDLPTAIQTYATAVETLRSTEDWVSIGVAMSKLGNAYLQNKQPNEAVQLLEAAIAMFRKERRADQESKSLGKLGSAYTQLNQWAKAQEHHERAVTLAREQFDHATEAEQFAAIGYLRELQRDREGSLLNYRRALHAAYLVDDVNQQVAYIIQLGEFMIDDTRTLTQAVQLLREAEEKQRTPEAERLLKRAEQRLKRASNAGLPIPPAEASNRDFAAKAYVA